MYVDDSISLAYQDLADNSKGDISEVISFSYSNIHHILNQADLKLRSVTKQEELSKLMLNSRVISVSLARPGRHVELSEPATIVLRHLDTNMSNPVCVYWDMEDNTWSDSGCEVKSTNKTDTVCQCSHLTGFALLMRPQEMTGAQIFFQSVKQRIDVIASVLAAILVFVMLLVVLKVRKFSRESRKIINVLNHESLRDLVYLVS